MTSETTHACRPLRRNLASEFEAEAIPQRGDLLSTATQLLGNRERAEDIVQDVYLLAWKHFERFEPGTKCRAWLFTILYNAVRNYRRKWQNVNALTQPGEFLERQAAQPLEIAQELTDPEVLHAVASIPPMFRRAILLVDVNDFSYREAARILEVPIGTVMSRLSRGRALLRERLARQAGPHGNSIGNSGEHEDSPRVRHAAEWPRGRASFN